MMRFIVPMLSTLVASVMVAAAAMTFVTYMRLNDTRHQLEKQKRMTNVLVDVASAQQTLISRDQNLIASIVNNQSSMLRMQLSLRSFAVTQGFTVR